MDYQVRENKDGTKSFQYRYRINGKQKTKSFKTANATKTAERLALRELEKFIKNVESKNILGLARDESNLTFADYSKTVFRIKDRESKLATLKVKNIYRAKVLEEIGHMKLREITPFFLDGYFLELSEDKSHHIVERHREVINTVLESAFKKDMIVVNPMLKLDFKFKKGTIKEKKVANIDDFTKLLNHSKKNIRYFFYLLIAYLTGMRRGEILALKWSDVDFNKSTININKSFNRYKQITPPKTEKSNRKILIADQLSEVLYENKAHQENMKRKYGDKYNDNNLVICQDNGDYINPNAVDAYLQRSALALDIQPIKSHQLRHTFATAMRGMEAKDVQQLMGHKNIEETVNTYQHHDKYKDDAIEQINSRLHKFI